MQRLTADLRASAGLTDMWRSKHDYSKITGLAFSPDGTRLYFSSQRGNTDSGQHGLSVALAENF